MVLCLQLYTLIDLLIMMLLFYQINDNLIILIPFFLDGEALGNWCNTVLSIPMLYICDSCHDGIHHPLIDVK